MVGENTVQDASEAPSGARATMRAQRFRSEIEFPYADLETVVELVEALHQHAGTSCEDDELAAWMNQSASGGTFRSRLSAARIFGLVETGQGRVTLTILGRGIVDAAKSRAARSDAFLKPELHAAMYEQFRGHVLPPAAAIERQVEGLGVSPKQKARARQTFVKSAQYAGFIDQTTGRFVKPGNGGDHHETASEQTENKDRAGGGSRGGSGGGGGNTPQHPLVVGLFQSLPPDGTAWSLEDAVDWLQAAAVNLRIAYKFKGSIAVKGEPPKILSESNL